MVDFKAKAILPSVPTNPKLLETLLDAGNKRVASQIRRDFEKTTATWSRKVKFFVTKKKDGNSITWFAGTDNVIYGYVTLGTPRHRIPVKNAPYLKFQSQYTPKTTPNILGSKRGGKSGGWVQVVEVDHPGTEARNFHVIIRDRFKAKAVAEANKALSEYLQRVTKPLSR